MIGQRPLPKNYGCYHGWLWSNPSEFPRFPDEEEIGGEMDLVGPGGSSGYGVDEDTTGCCSELDIFVPNKICGFRAHFGASLVVGGSRAVLDILEVTGRPSGRTRCLQQNTLLIKIFGKKSKKCVSLSNNAISNPLERKKLDIACFRKVLKNHPFRRIFVSPNSIF